MNQVASPRHPWKAFFAVIAHVRVVTMRAPTCSGTTTAQRSRSSMWPSSMTTATKIARTSTSAPASTSTSPSASNFPFFDDDAPAARDPFDHDFDRASGPPRAAACS